MYPRSLGFRHPGTIDLVPLLLFPVSCVQIYHYMTRNSRLLYLLFLQEFPRVLMRCIQVSRNFTPPCFPGLEFPITLVSLMFGWDWNSWHTRLETLKAGTSQQSHSGFDEIWEWVYFTESTAPLSYDAYTLWGVYQVPVSPDSAPPFDLRHQYWSWFFKPSLSHTVNSLLGSLMSIPATHLLGRPPSHWTFFHKSET